MGSVRIIATDEADRMLVPNPDGTSDKLWDIDKGRPLAPSSGRSATIPLLKRIELGILKKYNETNLFKEGPHENL